MEVLKFPKIVTELLCADSASISIVRPLIYRWIKHTLQTADIDEPCYISELKTKLRQYAEDTFLDSKSVVPTTRMIAPFFDPRYKDLEHESELDAMKIKDMVKDMLEHIPSNSSNPPIDDTSLNILFTGNHTPSVNSLDIEYKRYLSEITIDCQKDNPYLWWKERESIYPRMSKLAKKYLCIPATSSSSERCFSTAGNIVTAKRSSLHPENVNMLVFLYQNRHIYLK